MNKMLALVVLFLSVATPQMAQTHPKESGVDICYQWQTQVDASTTRVAIDNSTLTNSEIQEGIGCLLKLKGNKHKARFTGDTRLNLRSSEQYKPPKKSATVELAALYYISYLFYDNWEHAGSINIRDEDTGKMNSKTIILKAYNSYEKWFKKIEEIGLEEARKQKLDPLANSGISWN